MTRIKLCPMTKRADWSKFLPTNIRVWTLNCDTSRFADVSSLIVLMTIKSEQNYVLWWWRDDAESALCLCEHESFDGLLWFQISVAAVKTFESVQCRLVSLWCSINIAHVLKKDEYFCPAGLDRKFGVADFPLSLQVEIQTTGHVCSRKHVCTIK